MSSFTDHDAALLVAAQYAGDSSQFDMWVDDKHPSWRSVSWAAKIVQDHVVFVLEGSHDGYDWANDARFLPIDVNGAVLHRGFWENMQETWAVIEASVLIYPRSVVPPLIFIGHSKGAANADDLAWLALRARHQVLAIIRWGEPAPSYDYVLGSALQQAIPIRRSYINQKPEPRWPDEQDPIPALPLKIFGAKHPDQLIPVYAPPNGDDLLRWHHFGWKAEGGGYLSVTPDTVILP